MHGFSFDKGVGYFAGFFFSFSQQFNTGMAANHSGDYSRILRGVPIEEEFTPGQMLELFKERGWRVGLVIDLTYTNRYYEPQDFIDHGVRHSKIKCPGQIIPPDDIYQRLCGELSEFLSDPNNDGSLVAVHCTHGLNRTGYLICRYLMEKCGYDAETAIEAFNSGRGCDIERENYLKHLRNGCPQDELRKSPARDRLGETDHLISGSLSSSAAHRGHLRWQSGGARRNDEEGDRRSREEVAREKREAVRGPLAPSSGKQESPDLKQLSAESSIVNRGGGITAVKMMVV
ncbi:RNA/RNP complex-1-interacting phosphatase homolog [Geodia barretti]|uniref:RNA/RNP complex-1-interacting phosphatase homolog n=1 Tax=Geodia barretti TaxID=519541 RepID=A0AA35XGL0_GEOBA|nr:RNA/RNP complex-1-interacting phosphatase homolog [Geodia barretti]